MKILRAICRVYFLHITGILAIWLAMYYPGLDILLSIIYLFLLWHEGQYAARELASSIKKALVTVLWQIPGLILAGSVLVGLDQLTDFAYYFIFILELWVTPLLPLVSLLPSWMIMDKPIYYYFLFMIVPIMAFFYYLPLSRNLTPNS